MRLRGEAGSAVVEFALVVPVFMMILFGIIDFSRAFYVRSVLAAAVQEGARRASVLEDPEAQGAEIRSVVKAAMAARGGRQPDDASVTVALDNVGKLVTVRISNYELEFVTPLSRLVKQSRFTMSSEARSAWERSP